MQQRTSRFVQLTLAAAAASVALLAASAAQAQQAANATQASSATPAVGDAVVVNMVAKITKIDLHDGVVDLKGPKGHTVAVGIDPTVADIKKLKVGDEVHMQYRGALLLSADKVDPKNTHSRVTAEQIAPASDGVVVRTAGVQVVATIQKIDPVTREVTLSGAKRIVTLKASPDVALDKFKVGDNVMATYVSATAIDVTRNGQIVK
ncbi:hypothetical protein [Caballeronia sp. J97]|uniref:hypothetical protein n=1 Tax=Caballeronia sp. J97 TaxID=2805429 RepID=UPI002AB26730|nr:hypothetical protein [Caballeronia sp. J97]